MATLLLIMVIMQAVRSAIVATPGAMKNAIKHDQQLGLHGETSPHNANLRQHKERHFVALQTSMKIRKASAKSGTKSHRRLGRRKFMKRRNEAGRCRGRPMLWWIKMRRKCETNFGHGSRWDRRKAGGQCAKAWKDCMTDFYAVCCSQPKGPKTLNAYCQKAELEKKHLDKACKLEGVMTGMGKTMSAITETVIIIEKESEPTIVGDIDYDGLRARSGSTTNTPNTGGATAGATGTIPTAADTTSTPGTPGTAGITGTADTAAPTPTTASIAGTAGTGNTAGAAPTPAAEGTAVTGSTAGRQTQETWQTQQTQKAPAAAPPKLLDAPDALKPPGVPAKLSMAEKCREIKTLVKSAEHQMQKLKKLAKENGVRVPLDDDNDGSDISLENVRGAQEDTEYKDPDFVWTLKPILAMGTKLKALLTLGSFCQHTSKDDPQATDLRDDVTKNLGGQNTTKDHSPRDDVTKDQGGQQTAKPREDVTTDQGGQQTAKDHSPRDDATKDQGGDRDDDGNDDDADGDGDGDDDDDDDLDLNATAITDLLEYGAKLQFSINKFETGIHPHGYKWWRYRYEYSLVESFVLAWSVLLMYFLQWLFFGVSFFHAHNFYKTGRPATCYRYSFIYWVFHAACVCVMVFTAYMLYLPWGERNIFNLFAAAFHDFVDDRFRVPYLGYSWLFMVLDIQFQMFMTYSLYSLFIVMVVNNYIAAFVDWKRLDDGQEPAHPINRELYSKVGTIIRSRTATPVEDERRDLLDIFKSEGLCLVGVQELEDMRYGDMHDTFVFKIHLYLIDGLGKSIEHLVEVALATHVWLAICAVIVACLAHIYQLAFMFFLPVFLVVGFALLLVGFFISKHYLKLALDTKYDSVSNHVTVYSYCRAIQIILYCVFFSFARLLLSNDIFTHYPNVYFAAIVGLLAFLALLALFAGEVLKEATCALILVPHIPDEEFQTNLHEIKKWHTTVNCHECGVEQRPFDYAWSINYAGHHKPGAVLPVSRRVSNSSLSSYGQGKYSARGAA